MRGGFGGAIIGILFRRWRVFGVIYLSEIDRGVNLNRSGDQSLLEEDWMANFEPPGHG